MENRRILIWLPSPMGDAILATPALKAIRQRFASAEITFVANRVVQAVLQPSELVDNWIDTTGKNPFSLANRLRKRRFDQAILLKNSFGSALIVFLAGIPSRIGYDREGRGVLLTEKLRPEKLSSGRFRPVSMIDYYLAVASWLGAETQDRHLQLTVNDKDRQKLESKLPQINESNGPLVILVPGGAFGLSKCWPVQRFAQTADRLRERYNVRIVVSVSPDQTEKKIAKAICTPAESDIINLGANPLTLGELKALYAKANLVICNDTGPRHIATALGRRVITMFGPNDPAWTQTGYEDEVQIVGKAPCAPCLKPACNQAEHLCMNSISVDRVCQAAEHLLQGKSGYEISDHVQEFVEVSKSFFVDAEYVDTFRQLKLTSVNAVFSFDDGENLTKNNLAKYRSRFCFSAGSPEKFFFLKRYENPPIDVQLVKWLDYRGPVSCALSEVQAAKKLNAAGVKTPKVIAYGQELNLVLEKRSFVITEQVPNAESLEKQLPDYFHKPATTKSIAARRIFIKKLAYFVRDFHETGFCHRDLYLCHIFCDEEEHLTLIDLARTFRPMILPERFLVKDITQLYYSAPAGYFSQTDRLRFYKSYCGHDKLTGTDEEFIKQVLAKAHRMARHDRRHGRAVPFEDIAC